MDTRLLIKIGVAAVILIVAFLVARHFVLFAIESRVDPDNPYPVKGVDVSCFQKEIDWEGLEDEGYRFAFVKATEGSSLVDPNFEYNWKYANKTGMRIGAYHFLSFTTSGDDQADLFIDTVHRKWGMLPPVVDFEMYGEFSSNPPSKKTVDDVLGTFLTRIESKYHDVPIIYTNRYLYFKYLEGDYDDYTIWISDPEMITGLGDKRDWTFCQYSFEGTSESVGESNTRVDLDVFNGTRWDFRKL